IPADRRLRHLHSDFHHVGGARCSQRLADSGVCVRGHLAEARLAVPSSRSAVAMTMDVEVWSAPPALAPSDDTQPFVVELNDFSGPLDLLLSLIREERLDIADIPIARVAEQFLA